MSSDTTATPTEWYRLRDFQRDVIVAIARLDRADDTPYGLAIKREVGDLRDEDINHGRLYPNLNDLVDAGLLEKSAFDKRTNRYDLTERAREIMASHARILNPLCGERLAIADGGGD